MVISSFNFARKYFNLQKNVPRTVVLFAQFTPFFDQYKVLFLNTKKFYDNLFQIPSQAVAI